MKTNRIALVVLLLAIAFLIACGGHSNNGGGTGSGGGGQTETPKPQMASSVLPGTHIFAAKKTTTTAYSFGFLPKLYAQTGTVISLSQSWNGACANSPQGLTTPVSGVIYRLGQDASPNCSSQWTLGDSTGANAAAGAQAGQLVIGNGTLGNLVAWTSSGTHIEQSARLSIFVKRGTQTLDTGVFCTLSPGDGYQRCSSSITFQALDGDLVVATFAQGSANDHLVGLNVVFTKQ